MEVKSHEDLLKLIKICRKNGIDSIEIGQLKLSFKGEAPVSYYKKTKGKGTSDETAPVYTDEQVLNWSVQDVGVMNG
jgi:hypothetical protein